MVKIRLSRVGRTHAPMYRIVAIDSRKKRDGEALEILGTYNPFTKELVQYHHDRIEHWVAQGALVTDAVKKLQRQHKKSPVAAA
jgi:small subunit ribosomal protein S16